MKWSEIHTIYHKQGLKKKKSFSNVNENKKLKNDLHLIQV